MAHFKFDHVHLRSPDPGETAAFYKRMFDADVIESLYPAGSPYAGQTRFDMSLGGQKVLIAPGDSGRRIGEPPEAPYFGLEHFALEVDDLDAAAAELRAKGASFLVGPKQGVRAASHAFVSGPQGVVIELLQKRSP